MSSRTLIVEKPHCIGNIMLFRDLQSLIGAADLTVLDYGYIEGDESFWRVFYYGRPIPDFEGFLRYMANKRLRYMIVGGELDDVAVLVRQVVVLPIRCIYGRNLRDTAVHASDSSSSAEREIGLIEGLLKSGLNT